MTENEKNFFKQNMINLDISNILVAIYDISFCTYVIRSNIFFAFLQEGDKNKNILSNLFITANN